MKSDWQWRQKNLSLPLRMVIAAREQFRKITLMRLLDALTANYRGSVMSIDAADEFDEEFEKNLYPTLGPYFEDEDAKRRIERLTNKARWALRSVQRVGLDDKDAVFSAIRTALRREGQPDEAPEPGVDVWVWFMRLFQKKCAQYRDRQRTKKHGWTMESDHFKEEMSGSVAVADRQPNSPLDEEDIEAHIRHVMGLIHSELFTDDQKVLAEFLAKGFTPKEIADMLGKSPDTIRRRIRKLRKKIDPDYHEESPEEGAESEDGDGPIDIPDLG